MAAPKSIGNPFRFYGNNPSKPGWLFSNFSEHSVFIDEKNYATTEHYFQAMKFVTTDGLWADAIERACSPKAAKNMGGSRDHTIRSDWELVKDDVMRTALKAKAEQHKDFKDALLDTKNDYIIEASPWDYYWGEGEMQNGKNMLGILLMELRDSLR